MASAASGGSLETMFESLSHPEPVKSKLDYDALLKIPGSNEKAQGEYLTRIQSFLGYSSLHKSWVGLWALAKGNSLMVMRSNALL